MRKILFRGKRISGEWIEGDFSHCIVVGKTHIQHIEDNLSTSVHKVEPETVCQYTGLTDKNKKKIFEGDIVKNEYGYIGIVKWECCSFVLDWVSWNASRDLYIWSSAVEIIGNIFDNPELIETNHKKK